MRSRSIAGSFLPLLLAILAAAACLTQGKASILGSAENFTVLGGTGITSAGVIGTVISNGDVGLSPGVTGGITGFPPAVIINGAIIDTGPVTAQARADLITVQTALNLMPSDGLISSDMAGMVLPSGVYTASAAATLNGALVLDGQGNNNAYWVFQIGTSFSASANSSVTVINMGSNNGSDYGVFWNVGTTIIFGADNALIGNYISGTSITMGANTDGGARAFALAAITLDQNELNAYGGPEGSDWSGGLMYNQLGEIVPVPEPSTFILVALSILGLLWMRRPRLALQKA